MKIVIIPDSFKGTLSSRQVCSIVSERTVARFPGCNAVSVPVADGGEGTVDCFLAALGGERVSLTVRGPFGEPLSVVYGRHGRTAFIETASCAGLTLVSGHTDPMRSTTYGVGEQILHAVGSGCDEVILGLGGSCTNDCGCGMAAALGVRFLDDNGSSFVPTGGTLAQVSRIDGSALRLPREVKITAMCDIDNPLYGERGAAFVFAPQKGASPEQVRLLDDGLRHISGVIERDCGAAVADLPGAGAAGGMGAGCAAFMGAVLKSGIDTVLDAVGFDSIAADADAIITGEGRFDEQSLSGKVCIGVARRAKALRVPVIVIAGGCEGDLTAAYSEGVTAVFTVNRLPEDFSISKNKSAKSLSETADAVLRLIAAFNRNGD